MSFIPLRINSGFSYLKSGLSLQKIIKIAKKSGYGSLGLSDYENLNGLAPFGHLCLDNEIKPIYGMEIDINGEIFVLFIKNEEGYRNLLKISFEASKKKADLNLLIERSEGLNIIYDLGTSFLKDHYKEDPSSLASSLASRLLKLPNAYLGLPYLPSDAEYVSFLRDFAEKHSYEIIALPHIRYEKKEDAIVILITEAIKENIKLAQKHLYGSEYFLSTEEISRFYLESEINRTEIIAENDFNLFKKRGSLLRYQNDEGLSSEEYLRKKSLEGLKRLNLEGNKEYLSRLDHELNIIHKMGYDDYFLMVWDYVNFAKEHDIPVGPGRGSGPASLVSYALNISTIDPLKHTLLFERFLNPERSSMPDIDVDFSDLNRDLVVAYLQNKYGKERVGHVLTNQTIGPKEALRDIGRVYGYPERAISLLSSSIENERSSLGDNYRNAKAFKDLIDSDPYYLEIVSLAAKIEGLPRQAGLHAAGIILNNEPLENVMPSKYDEGGYYVGCLEKDYLEEQGFLKMDLLGLRNLSIIDKTLELLEKRGIKLKMEDIPYEDEKPISLILNHEVTGLFQLESAGMQRAIDEVKPTNFDDVVALIALFRPGPMSQIRTYAQRKNGLEKVSYLTPEIEEILKPTYGIIVYQEQIMQIVQKLAGFSLGEADLFRRAISKKNASKLASYKSKFIKGCLNNGKNEKQSEELFDLIFAFANYGFNKAHAVSYGVITARMAYLKYYYPNEFYSALLSFMATSSPKFKTTVSELRKRGIFLALPDINEESDSYAVSDNKIRFPLSSIKGINTQFLNSLREERLINGAYKDIFDLALRTKKFGLNLTSLIRLIDAGALDGFKLNRASLRASAFSALQYAEMLSGTDGMSTLLDIGLEKPQISFMEDTLESDLNAEYEAMGIMISSSPLKFYEDKIKISGAVSIAEALRKVRFKLAGVLKEVRAITNKKGVRMGFIEIYDEISEMTLVIFAETYDKCYPFLKEDAPLLIEGYLGKKGFVAEKIEPLGEQS